MRKADPYAHLKALREGGMVQRCHTLPHHGSYSVAEHSYGVAQLIFTYCSNPSVDLIQAALNHDVAERWTGDIPAPAKWLNYKMKEGCDLAEQDVEDSYDLAVVLTREERRWLKGADIMELWLWSLEQQAMGNLRAGLVRDNINEFLRNAKEDFLPAPLHRLWTEYAWSYLPEDLPTKG